jgi:hypothetical protein
MVGTGTVPLIVSIFLGVVSSDSWVGVALAFMDLCRLACLELRMINGSGLWRNIVRLHGDAISSYSHDDTPEYC